MADISQIKLPNNNIYNLKDPRAYRRGEDLRHKNSSIDQAPQYISLINNKMTSEYLQTIRTIAGVGDYFYALNKNPDYTISCNYSGQNGTKGSFSLSTLFSPGPSSTVLLDVDAIAETPFVLTINKKKGVITATDVVNIELFGHTLGDSGAKLSDYKVELYTTGTTSPTGTFSWQTVYERHNVSDSINGLVIALNATNYSYLYFSGVRFTISGGIPGSTSSNAWNYNCIDLTLFRLTDQRPAFSAARAVGALDINGGDVYGNANFKSGINVSGVINGNGSSITSINGSNISSGTIAADRIAALPASKITSGTFDAARIPNLDASKITSGTISTQRLPVATSNSAGIMKAYSGDGIATGNNGAIYINRADSSQIKAGESKLRPIVPYNQHESTFYGLAKVAGADMASSSNAVGTYTDAAKGAIQNMLGINNMIAPIQTNTLAIQAYSVNDLFWYNGKLYKVTAAIAQNGNIVIGTNCIETRLTDNYISKSIGTTTGDLIYYSDNAEPTRLSIGNQGQVLKVNASGLPSWSNDINTNTTYTFTSGTNQFTVTPSNGSAQTVTVTPNIANNITGTGTNDTIAKFNGTNTITSGPKIVSTINDLNNNNIPTVQAVTQFVEGKHYINSIPVATTSAYGIVQLSNATNSTSTTTVATSSAVKAVYDLAASKTNNTGTVTSVTLSAGAGISITDNDTPITTSGGRTITNTGVTSISSGTANGTINVTTNGNTSAVSVHGLGSAAYTNTTAYATATQGNKADAAMPKSGGTFTGAVTLAANPTSNLQAATKQYVDNNVSISNTLGTGTQIGQLTINGTTTTLYAPPPTTHTIAVTQSASTPTLQFVMGTQTSSTASMTGVLASTTTIANGKIIFYLLPYAATASQQTLTLTYANTGTNTGAIPIYTAGNVRSEVPYPAYTTLILLYYNSRFYIVNNNVGVIS